jgi:hypothetical protein
MTQPVPRDILARIRKLALLPEEVRQSRWAINVTRLTSLKSLCRDPEVAHRFVTYLARKTLDRVEEKKDPPGNSVAQLHREMMAEAVVEMETWLREPTETRHRHLWELLGRIRDEQNEFKRVKSAVVRIIRDSTLLLVEYALNCVVHSADQAGDWAYQTARHYAERYAPSEGTGLTSKSVPLLQDIAGFWIQEFDLDLEALLAPPKKAKKEKPLSLSTAKKATSRAKKPAFTHRQGQFLAFIHLYRKLHRRGPAETDLRQFFGVTTPSAHGMIVKLEELGLVTREPGVARSVRVAIPEEDIPPLEDVAGPPWPP